MAKQLQLDLAASMPVLATSIAPQADASASITPTASKTDEDTVGRPDLPAGFSGKAFGQARA